MNCGNGGFVSKRNSRFPSATMECALTSDIVLDLLVENEVVVELKAIETVLPVHKAQLLSYLRLGGKRLGLLINFHVDRLKDGITRLVNGF